MRGRQGWVAVFTTLVVLLAACGGGSTDAPDFVGSGQVDEGDCLNLPEEIDAVVAFEARDCGEGHDGQVLGVFDLPDGDGFPGNEEVLSTAESGCIERFEGFIGVSYAESVFFLQSFTPTEETWTNDGDRTVLCVVVPGEGTGQLTSDLRGVAE